MSLDKTIYIWDGGVFSPPTRAVGKLAYNIATYISSLHNNKLKVEYHFVPSNKYYNKPWVRCVEEDDRIYMLKNLVTFINKEYSVPKNIKFVVSKPFLFSFNFKKLRHHLRKQNSNIGAYNRGAAADYYFGHLDHYFSPQHNVQGLLVSWP